MPELINAKMSMTSPVCVRAIRREKDELDEKQHGKGENRGKFSD